MARHPMVAPTSATGSRLIFDIELLPFSTKPSAALDLSVQPPRWRISSRLKCASKRRINGPMLQLALLSLARGSSSAERPFEIAQVHVITQSRTDDAPPWRIHRERNFRFRIIPAWNPGGYQHIGGSVPRRSSAAPLVNTSASGPIPTSRYCDHIAAFNQNLLSSSCACLDRTGLHRGEIRPQ